MLSFEQLIARNHQLIALAATVQARCWDAVNAANAHAERAQRHASVMHALAVEHHRRMVSCRDVAPRGCHPSGGQAAPRRV